MAKYLLVYHGGDMAKSDEELKERMDQWGAWFGSLGSAVIDGGNPVPSTATVDGNGNLVKGGGANPATGYSLIEASDMDDAHAKAKGCPLLKHGGTIELGEALDM